MITPTTPYGEILTEVFLLRWLPLKTFALHETDVETGLIYAQARWLDPATGEFTSEDPLMDGLNWYAYCGGDPVNRVDPTGLREVIGYDENGDLEFADPPSPPTSNNPSDDEEPEPEPDEKPEKDKPWREKWKEKWADFKDRMAQRKAEREANFEKYGVWLTDKNRDKLLSQEQLEKMQQREANFKAGKGLFTDEQLKKQQQRDYNLKHYGFWMTDERLQKKIDKFLKKYDIQIDVDPNNPLIVIDTNKGDNLKASIFRAKMMALLAKKEYEKIKGKELDISSKSLTLEIRLHAVVHVITEDIVNTLNIKNIKNKIYIMMERTEYIDCGEFRDQNGIILDKNRINWDYYTLPIWEFNKTYTDQDWIDGEYIF